ncbi:MAG: glycosyltransferase family 39 protein [Gaiellales bacterium]
MAPSDTVLALVGAYFLLVTLYAWQAWRRETPTLFTDELEFTQISRAIATTGHPGRRGEAFGFTSLAPWFTAPFWWIDKVSTAFEAIKYFQAIVMALAIFPAYAMGRRVLSTPWALFAAIGTIATPALSYSPFLVEEPFAYPIAVTALWLIVRAVERPAWRSVGLAAVAVLVAMLTRGQLTALLATLAVSLAVLGWSSPPLRRWQETWTRRDRVGAIVLGIGLVFLLSSFLGWQSKNYADVTAMWKVRILQYGAWSLGGFSIGIGIVPVIALLAVPFVRGDQRRKPELRAFLLVAGTATAAFVWYAAIKGAYLSTQGYGGIIERNLIYLTPLAFVATGLVLDRLRPPAVAVVAASAVVVGALVWTPVWYGVRNFPYYEAHGLAIVAFLNRELSWPEVRIETAAWLAPIIAGTIVLAASRLHRGALGRWLPLVVALLVLAWNQTNQVYAAIGEHDNSHSMAKNLTSPPDWIDQAVGPAKTTILGQHVSDGAGVWDNEFWNRSVARVWTVDGDHPPGPGRTVTPDLIKADGTLWPRPPTPYVLEVNGVELVGEEVARNKAGAVLVKLGEDFRLRWNQEGVSADGWTTGVGGASKSYAAYNRFDVSQDGNALVVVTLSREAFCPPSHPPIAGEVEVKLGPIAVSAEKEPALGSISGRETRNVGACTSRPIAFPAPKVPWRVEITADTFVPKDVAPEYRSDTRALGVRPTIEVVPAETP